MTDSTPWAILVVDDDDEILAQVKELLDGEEVSSGGTLRIEIVNDFSKALNVLEEQRIDLVILDVKLALSDSQTDDEAGIQTLDAIKQRRFVPVIFYTAIPNKVQELAPLIRVVEKSEVDRLEQVVDEMFMTRLPRLNRALLQHLENTQRDYMWNFVSLHWEQLTETSDHSSLAYLLAARLARAFSGTGVEWLANQLGGDDHKAITEGAMHPMKYYVMPPIEQFPLTGDIYKGDISSVEGYWIILTPSCDMVSGREKADNVLFARCLLLSDQDEHREWISNESSTKEKNLKGLLGNNRKSKQRERFHYLPSALSIPDLIVDFQELVSVPVQNIQALERIASLDNPFAEYLVTRFGRYIGRIGVPDLDYELILQRLKDNAPR